MPEQLTVDINLLRPNPWNSNVVSPENETKLAESIETLGQFKPIVVRSLEDGSGYQILGGEHRWQALKAAGKTKVYIFSLGIIPDEKAKLIALADNARYGADDTTALAKILESLGDVKLQDILPYTDADLTAITASSVIALDALDELDLEDGFEKSAGTDDKPVKPPKTHTIMRFKVSLEDAEALTEKFKATQLDLGLKGGDQLQNAGDALVHLLLGGT